MQISVVAPIYNELDNIRPLTERITKAVEKQFTDYEIVYVNDGSKDGSKELLDQLAKENPKVKVYHFTQNNGQTAAIAAGFQKCEGDIVLMMDADMQTDPEDLYELLKYMPEYDMVNGMRATREDGLKRKVSSLVGNGVRNFITGDDIRDTGCPLKLFKKSVVKDYKLFEGMHRFLPTLAKYNGYRVIEVPVRHYDRVFGVSKYGVWNRLFKGLRDAFAVRWMRYRMLRFEIEGDKSC